MSIQSAISKYNEFVGNDINSISGAIGLNAAQSALHMSYPNEFEYYMMALELVSYNGKTIDYFVFPVNPSTYSQDEPSVTSIRKTMGGVSAVGNSSFVPIDIRISGNFGKRFKILVGKGADVSATSVAQYSTTSGVFNKEGFIQNVSGRFRKAVMDSKVKTGYGAIKILQAICDKSRGDMQGKPNQLYLYNPAYNANFLVKVVSFSQSQNVGGNFIWGYELVMKAIAPIEAVVGVDEAKKSLKSVMNKNIMQVGASKTLMAVNNILNR